MIHTARDQGALVRPYVKWDDQPASPGAAREALLRGAWIAQTAPMGPVYINLDAEMQEAKLEAPLPPIDAARYTPPPSSAAPVDLIAEAVEILRGAERPVILAGRVSRDLDAWTARIKLAESLGARVVTDLKVGAAFPTDHFLHAGAPGVYAVPEALDAVREADAILSLDWVDLAGILKAASGASAPAATIIQVSLDHQVHNGWSMDHQALPPIDLFLAADPDKVVPAMMAALGPSEIRVEMPERAETPVPTNTPQSGPIPSSRWGRRCAAPSAHVRSRSRICRCRGMARPGRSVIRSISSAPMAAAGSGPGRASPWGPRWRCAAAAAWRSGSAATAIS